MSAAPDVMVRVLGPIEVTVDGRPVPIGGPRCRTVLATLLLGQGALVPVARIVDAIWGDDPPRTAVVKVQGHVCALRKALGAIGYPHGAHLLRTQPPGYRLAMECCRSDLHEFVSLSAEGTRLRHLGEAERAAAVLGRALDWWRGPAFADAAGEEVRCHAVRINQLRLLAMEDKASQDLLLGRFRVVLAELGPVVHEEPLRERSRELLIRAMLGMGQRHAALRCYEEGRLRLRDDLGVAPGARLRLLAESIRETSRPAPARWPVR